MITPKRTLSVVTSGRHLVAVIALTALAPAWAQTEDEADLAKKLANPVAALISVPFQMNYDDNFGVDDEGSVLRTNVQPVIPISLGQDWNLISRTILPIVDQNDFPTPGISEFGLGDTVQSLFFSPESAYIKWLDLGCRPRVSRTDRH